MASAADLYRMTPEQVTHDLYFLESITPEIPDWYHVGEGNETSKKIEYRILKDWDCGDGYRGWQLGTVWFEGKPVMVVQKAGRSNRDHKARFITDKALFKSMIEYVQTLVEDDEDDVEVIPLNEDMEELTHFYGMRLETDWEMAEVRRFESWCAGFGYARLLEWLPTLWGGEKLWSHNQGFRQAGIEFKCKTRGVLTLCINRTNFEVIDAEGHVLVLKEFSSWEENHEFLRQGICSIHSVSPLGPST